MKAKKAKKTVKLKRVVIKGKGKKPVPFNEGGLHQTTHTPADKKIPAAKMAKALKGGYGKKGKKEAVMAKGMLAKGRATAASNRAKKKKK